MAHDEDMIKVLTAAESSIEDAGLCFTKWQESSQPLPALLVMAHAFGRSWGGSL